MKSYRQRIRQVLGRIGLGTVGIAAIPVVLAFIWLRFFGLPQVTKDYLLAQVAAWHLVPYPIAVDRLLLDPTGAILAERVTVFRDAGRQSVMLQVDRVRVTFAWLSWWQGRGLVHSASIANAEVRLPMGPEDTADFHEVNADVYLDGHDIKVENGQARFLDLNLTMRGIIHNDGFPKAKPPTAQELASRQQTWRAVVSAVDDIGTERPLDLDLEFDTSTRDLPGGRANFSLEGRHLTWRSAPVDELSLHGSLGDGIVTLGDFKVGLDRGELTAYGDWNLADHAAEVEFTSSMDFTVLAPAFPGPLGQALNHLDFNGLAPSMAGRVLFDLSNGFHPDIQADIDWRDFTFNGVAFQRFSIPIAYDGRRLLIPELRLEGAAGNANLQLFYDSTGAVPSLNGKIVSTIDPTLFKGVFGQGMDNFLGSCSFPEGGPKIEATATGSALKTAAWTVTGKLTAGKFSYKSAAFNSATSDFTFADSRLALPNLLMQRPEGSGGGGLIYDFKNRSVELHNLVTQVNVAEVAPVMGPKFTQYTSPYHFSRPPTVRANGVVDLQDQKKDLDTNLTVEVQGRSPMGWNLFHTDFSFDNPNGVLLFRNRRLLVNMKQCGFYEGSLTGTLDMDLRSTPADYVLDLNLAKVDFKKFMVRVFSYGKSTGSLNSTGHFTGRIGDMGTLNGSGEVKISDGDITQIPFLGSLTPLIPGFTDADAAHAHFTAAHGIIHTDDLHISSETLALIGSGNYNFVRDRVDLDMRVNANAVFGIFLYPISKIFEFHGDGPMKNVNWEPRNF